MLIEDKSVASYSSVMVHIEKEAQSTEGFSPALQFWTEPWAKKSAG
jgi:hypothetical protein